MLSDNKTVDAGPDRKLSIPPSILAAVCKSREDCTPHVLGAIAIDWCVIIGCALIWVRFQAWWLLPLLVYIVGGRQHGLAVLMHETVHQKLAGSVRFSQLAGSICCWPLMVSWTSYQRNHLAHHRFLNTEADPDLSFKLGSAPADWQFPRSAASLGVLLLKDLIGNGVITNTRRMLRYRKAPTSSRPQITRDPALRRWLFVIAFVSTWVWAFGIASFAELWVLPLFTALPFLLRIRSISEHFGMKGDEDERARNVRASWFERELLGFGPHCVGWHRIHHLIPHIPANRLIGADGELRSRWAPYASGYRQYDGYIIGRNAVVRELVCD